ncbi:MAG TPA: universal stress protein [Fodinibius sp.]|nr:universal stress protein [Fodinibius sp.]
MFSSINQVLFPTDFSENAKKALPYAAEIAYQTDAKLTLFHASQEPMYLAPNFDEVRKQTVQKTDRLFNQLIDELQEDDRFKKLNISTVLQLGQPVTGLLEYARQSKAGLIVMGTKGATGSRNIMLGSVATSVVKKSGVPTLTVPHESSFDGLKKITFTTDFKETDWTALEQTIELARLFGSTVDVLHITENRGFKDDLKCRGFRDLITEKSDYENISFSVVRESDFFPGAADYIAEHESSLMVMVRYKKSFWENISQRSHSKEMAFYSTVPLLIIPGNENS